MEAWRLYHQVATRFCRDWGLVVFRLERELAGVPAAAALDLLDRLELLYNRLQPPTPRES